MEPSFAEILAGFPPVPADHIPRVVPPLAAGFPRLPANHVPRVVLPPAALRPVPAEHIPRVVPPRTADPEPPLRQLSADPATDDIQPWVQMPAIRKWIHRPEPKAMPKASVSAPAADADAHATSANNEADAHASGASNDANAGANDDDDVMLVEPSPASSADASSANDDANAHASANEALTTVILDNLCDMRCIDLLDWPTFYEDMVEDVGKECQKFGEIVLAWADRAASNASVWLSFSNAEKAQICVQNMNNRRFAGMKLRATLHPAHIWHSSVGL